MVGHSPKTYIEPFQCSNWADNDFGKLNLTTKSVSKNE